MERNESLHFTEAEQSIIKFFNSMVRETRTVRIFIGNSQVHLSNATVGGSAFRACTISNSKAQMNISYEDVDFIEHKNDNLAIQYKDGTRMTIQIIK